MTILGYEICHHPELSWWDGRYRVWMVGTHTRGLIGAAWTKRGARRALKGLLNREQAARAYTVVESMPACTPCQDQARRRL
jgi:hypothetical protein